MRTTKQNILDVSLLLFSEKGYEGAGMEEIAARVGIKKASLYSHFSGKKEIFKVVFENIIFEYRDFISRLVDEIQKMPVKVKLKKIISEYVFYNKRNIGMSFWDRFYYFPPEEFKDYIYNMTDSTKHELETILEGMFREGIKNGELRKNNVKALVSAYYYILIGLTLSVGLFSESELKNEVNKCINMFIELI